MTPLPCKSQYGTGGATSRKGNAALGISIGVLLALFLFVVFIGIPHYEMEDTIRLLSVNDHSSFHYPVPIPGDATLCAGNVTVQQGNPVALEDGMTYTMFASGDGQCAFTTQVRVLRWRRLFG